MFGIAGNASVLAGYNIDNAALFDGGHLTLTPGTAGDRKANVISAWILPNETNNATHKGVVGCGNFWTGSTWGGVYIDNVDKLYGYDNSIADTAGLTTAKYRDETGWLHVVRVLDAANTTSYLYVNNVLVATDTSVTNADGNFMNTVVHYIGENGTTSKLFRGMMAEIHVCEGDATLLPSDFGETDADTGNWIAKKYTGTYGANGFYLDFSNSGALGTDASGNGNNWTVNGTITSVSSTPTNTAATLNPLHWVSAVPTFSNGNLTVSSSSGYKGTYSTLKLPSTGKFYFEAKPTGTSSNANPLYMGIANGDWTTGYDSIGMECIRWQASGFSGMSKDGSGFVAVSGTVTTTDVVQVAVDIDNLKIWFGKNNTWYDSAGGATGNPSAGTNACFSTLITDPLFALGMNTNGWDVTFLDADFTYAAPTGFSALTTDNLPTRSPKTPSTPQTGSFTGNANADGPFINLGMAIDQSGTSTINGNTITWGTHADACATGVKLRTSSASYNASGSNTYSFAVKAYTGGSNVPEATAQGNPE